MKLYDIVVVGAGPAGMMAAIRAGQLGKNVMLIEKNDTIGEKLKITGSSRCNITNTASLDTFMEKFGKKGAFFRSAFAALSNRRLMSFFEAKGLKFKIEENGRVFPVTDKSRSVIKVLKEYLSRNKVKINYNTQLVRIKKKKDYFSLDLGNDNYMATKKVILATGGMSYPATGSTGDGFKVAQKVGHKVTPLRPGIVPLKVAETHVKELQGISIENARLTFKYGKRKLVSGTGNMIFTHFGISGPLVLDLSSQIVRILEKNETVNLFIDLKPEMTDQELQKKIMDEFENRSKTEFKNLMKLFMPNRMIPIVAELLDIDPKKKVNQIKKGERNGVVNLLKAFPLTVTGSLPIEKAMVTCGGVSRKEINPQTMESKVMEGVYFAGEIIDFCAPSGGYNLQEAFSTGYLAGEMAANSLDN
ncbi:MULTISPECIES: NAD(P)/FAD-dependent oxidoreductase [Methanobacterium]|uniref:NAD(P)/FAD-dependent oxidoreductase n=1 Tax=Methanobacterium veterum TaxID=408577 RepID=A0A9E5A2W1_9EURY|nr:MULTISPECIES: NAD(P)/FAD-dependent oxidoreductase [Methanobacterium]MCZ3364346.1 NAD(P)/FAD-dependent oxidoreductase [Methanobacterium veterum]MCZ3372096.1 NAD(P)/FAD-dependent oxidoreductase [Methanobacterium veterum]